MKGKRRTALALAVCMVLQSAFMNLCTSHAQEKPAPSEMVPVIIFMEGEAVVEENSAAVLNDESKARMSALQEMQADVIKKIEENVLGGEALSVSCSYTWLFNGVAATVPYDAIADIEALDGVEQVALQRKYYSAGTGKETKVSYPMTISDGIMIGREETWAAGYTGEGMKIAVLDTGIDTDHPNFGPLADDVFVSATKESLNEVISSLNAYSLYSGNLTADDVYLNSKLAYVFDYGERDTDPNTDPSYGDGWDHGTHVAGIAAANKVDGSDVVGVAPDAQLFIMRVQNEDGYMADEYVLAAIEDALLLGADVINMSFGATAGFVHESEAVDEIYERATKTGTVLAIAAGNDYAFGYGNQWGLDANLTSNPDNAVIGSPGTYENALTVASVENVFYMGSYLQVGDKNIGYDDGLGGKNEPFRSLGGQTIPIVAVPGFGEASDYEGIDVEGKIALVMRGALNFSVKCQNAQDAGAVACLIYNNEAGILSMDLSDGLATIPCASITMQNGAYILDALRENAELTVFVSDEDGPVASDVAYQMSDFTSWGVAPDLSLEPDIAAPGGNIYSTLGNGTYGTMSGTSMATPNLAGISALVSQYVKDTYGYSGQELHDFVQELLMSTSVPLSYDDALYFSPRRQGSGLAAAFAAIATRASLSVEGCNVPKAELGDDAERTGSYAFQFVVNNFGKTPLFYDLATIVQTEDVNDDYADFGLYFMTSTPRALDAATNESSDSMVLRHDVNDDEETNSYDAYLIYQAAVAGNPHDENWTDVAFRYETDATEEVNANDVQAYLEALVENESPADLDAKVLCVPAGAEAVVDVSIELTDSDKAYFATYYENGCYVEGYTFLSAKNTNGVDLSLPYLGFYGAWDEAPVFDGDFYWGQDDASYSQFMLALFTQFGDEAHIPGTNPYLEEEFDESHISLSPNGDGYADYIDEMFLSLLRNAAELSVTYTGEDGTVYSKEILQYVRKSSYSFAAKQCMPTLYSWYSDGYDLTDASGAALPNNTKLTLTLEAVIEYAGAKPDERKIPITIDTGAPELLSSNIFYDETDEAYYADLTFKDNLSVACVGFLDSTQTTVYDVYTAPDAQATLAEDGSLVWNVRYDVTGYGDQFTVFFGDYAVNESYYELQVPGNGTNLDGTEP